MTGKIKLGVLFFIFTFFTTNYAHAYKSDWNTTGADWHEILNFTRLTNNRAPTVKGPPTPQIVVHFCITQGHNGSDSMDLRLRLRSPDRPELNQEYIWKKHRTACLFLTMRPGMLMETIITNSNVNYSAKGTVEIIPY